MSNDTVPQAPRALFPKSAPPAQPRTESVTSAATARVNHPSMRAAAAPSQAPVAASPVSTAPRVEPPRLVSAMTPERVPAQIATTRAAPMHRELTNPLRELIQRRSARDFAKVFEDLVAVGVSDVHMTRSGSDGTFTVEARVDGKKQPVHVYTGSEAQTIVNLIKTDAKMTTDPTVIPEDGSYSLPINGYPYRARAVSLPTFDTGERLVFRLPQTGPLRKLDELGFSAKNIAAVKQILAIPGGMTLLAGPTAEGKSTTALSILKYLQEMEDGVVLTLEDPVERVMPGMTQMEVKEEVEDAGFADMMKYLVRSDANIIFIGEIRDPVTATAAVEIAKAGRRVIATIHASDNVSAFLRLIGLANDTPLSVLDSINGVVSQRLVPRLVAGTDRFAGRYPIHEVTQNSDELTDALVADNSRSEIRKAAAATSTTFKENVDELVADGITTLAEARKTVRNV